MYVHDKVHRHDEKGIKTINHRGEPNIMKL